MDAQAKQELFRLELRKAMERLESSGISYPPGYYEKLLGKYPAFRYPKIVARIGEPNIRKHPAYRSVLKKEGRLLDYGCGTGDDIRALIVDGYPKGKITGYDVDFNSINLGFDLYEDKKDLKGIFIVSKEPYFKPGSFDVVYSGSVLHGLERGGKIESYLSKARELLTAEGLLFGSTIGTDPSLPRESPTRPKTMLLENELRNYLRGAGFDRIRISRIVDEPEVPRYRLWFSGVV